jgi:putative hydrolase of the HAD superfamily
VLSNNNPAAMVAIRGAFTADGHTMDDYFDKIYLSYELHELKPSEAIFRKVIADSGVIPSETLFIDDRRSNLEAAAAFGIATFHFREPESSCTQLREMLLQKE